MIKREVKHDVPQGMQRFVFNMRRPLFQDIRVREALGYALDFQWYNKTYFYNSYKRSKSYWNNCDLGSTRPAGGRRAGAPGALSRPRARDRVHRRVRSAGLSRSHGLPRRPAHRVRRCSRRQAGAIQGNRLVNDATGQPFEFEFMNDEPQARAGDPAVPAESRAARHQGHHPQRRRGPGRHPYRASTTSTCSA